MTLPIVILTDFGTSDPFVGILKGVIAGISPESPIIDLTHEIPPGDIRLGSITLWQSVSYFPKGSIFLCVVDPGVGTKRNPIILETGENIFVGPDNGLFSLAISDPYRAWVLENPALALPNPRSTFHGRDIFAPAAAHAASGVSGSAFGPKIRTLIQDPSPILKCPSTRSLEAEIIHIDRFGNALTSLGQFNPKQGDNHIFDPWIGDLLPAELNLQAAYLEIPRGDHIPWAATFANIPEGNCAFLIGSSGLLEIAANRQSGAKMLDLKTGDRVRLVYPETQFCLKELP